MYIEFQLPTGAGGMAAQYINSVLNRNLHEWSDRYQIAYNKKIHKYTVRVTFDNDDHYTLFAMTWQPTAEQLTSYVKNYRIIEPMSRPS